jgi:O-acetyl-ADP-ribose deacetylase (regulator of RNase III)
MVHIIEGSVFDTGCDIWVNTINCRGVMRAGIALEFALRYPKMYEAYVQDCQSGKVKIGKTYLYVCDGQKILNFPTKDDYKEPSLMEYLVDGLKFFVEHYKEYCAKSIAFPLLGCTNGGLDFEKEVKPLMLEYLSGIDMDVYICTNSLLTPESLEFYMLNAAKNTDAFQLITDLQLDNTTPALLSENIKCVDRFWKLASSKMVGSKDNYIKIWNYFYLKIQGEQK